MMFVAGVAVGVVVLVVLVVFVGWLLREHLRQTGPNSREPVHETVHFVLKKG